MPRRMSWAMISKEAMPKHHKLLVVVADGEHARFVRPALDNSLHSEIRLESATAHHGAAPGQEGHARAK